MTKRTPEQLAKAIVERLIEEADSERTGLRYSPLLRDTLYDSRAWVADVIAEMLRDASHD
jgi:hypothetical protein